MMGLDGKYFKKKRIIRIVEKTNNNNYKKGVYSYVMGYSLFSNKMLENKQRNILRDWNSEEKIRNLD